MKVAFVIQDTGTLYGAERVTLQLMSWLMKEPDLEVVLCLIKETRLGLTRSDIQEAAEAMAIPVVEFEVDHAFSARLVLKLRRFCKDASIDIFHTSGPKAVFHALPATVGLGTQCVSTVHGWLFRTDLKEQVYAAIDCFMLRRCSRVVVLSRYYQSLLLDERIPPQRLVRIPTGIEKCPPAEKLFATESVFNVGFAGRMSEEKQPEVMLALAKESLSWSRPVRFHLAGDGHLLDGLKSEALRRGVDACVEFVGYVPSETFLPTLDLLVNCSKIENLPYSILEAMRLGIPVVAFEVGGIPDLIEDGENGFLISEGDVETMSEKIRILVSDPTLAQKMGVSGRQRISDFFTPSRVVQAHKELYESCLASPGGR